MINKTHVTRADDLLTDDFNVVGKRVLAELKIVAAKSRKMGRDEG